MKKETLSFSLIIIALLPAIAFGKLNAKKIYEKADYACSVYLYNIIKAEMTDSSTQTFTIGGSGSCVAVNYDKKIYILTNAHVVKLDEGGALSSLNEYLKQEKIEGQVQKIVSAKSTPLLIFKNNPSKILPVSAENIDAERDLANLVLISTPAHKSISGVEIENKEISIGEEVAAIGNPHNIPFTLSIGNIANIVYSSDSGGKRIMTASMIGSGSSGCPLINKGGKLIGIARSSHRYKPPHFSFFIHRDEILSYLKKIHNQSP